MQVFVVLRKTDSNGRPDCEPMAVFSSLEAADRQARILKTLYDIEVHELEMNIAILEPQGSATPNVGL